MTSHAPGVVTLKPLTVILPALFAPLRAGACGDGGALAGAAIARVSNLCLYIENTLSSDTIKVGYEKASPSVVTPVNEPTGKLWCKCPLSHCANAIDRKLHLFPSLSGDLFVGGSRNRGVEGVALLTRLPEADEDV